MILFVLGIIVGLLNACILIIYRQKALEHVMRVEQLSQRLVRPQGEMLGVETDEEHDYRKMIEANDEAGIDTMYDDN